MTHLTSLSKRQRVWFIATLAAIGILAAVGWILEPAEGEARAPAFTTAMSIRDIALRLGVTGKALARELGLPIEAPKAKPLKSLGIRQEDLDRTAAHLESHRPARLRYFLFAALVVWGLVFLCRLGRPDGATEIPKRLWYPRTPYLIALLAAGPVFGFWLGKSPNPMEGVVKVFKAMVGLYPSVADKFVALVFFLALAVVGNKLICGWACPFGALQELLFSLPVLKRVKRRKIPFLLSNGVRAILFLAALLLLFGFVGGEKGFVLYHSMNPFNLFDLDFESAPIALTIVLALGLSLPLYRPFCQFICPFGLISWLVERFSLAKVRIDPVRCNKCGACAQACPLEAAGDRVAGKRFAAECYSCARCLKVCPEDAIAYGFDRLGGTGEDGTKRIS